MSLLLDALKRAEQEKLARRDQEGRPAGHEPQAPERAAPSTPRRQLELEDQEPGRAAPAAAEPAPGGAKGPDREGAKAVFAAKQAASATPSPSQGRSKAIIAVVIGAVAVAAAGGAYVWYEISAKPGPVASAARQSPAPRPVTPAPSAATTAAPASAAPAPEAPSPVAGAEPKAEGAAPAKAAAAVPPVAVLRPESAAAPPAKPKPQPKAAEILVMNLLKDSRKAGSAAPLKLSRTIEPPRVPPEVSRGYEALRNGEAAEARRLYEAALAADPTSLDAHLGLAASAARMGDRETAASHYRRTLALDPRNPSAVAGLAALADFSRPEALEAQLRADITRFPQSPALHFTLGNLYARQSRWNEAQAAYFDAYRLDPESADLAFNLAVSLDHLGQSRPAAEFYRRALAAAGKQSALFDKGQVSRRLAELKP